MRVPYKLFVNIGVNLFRVSERYLDFYIDLDKKVIFDKIPPYFQEKNGR